MFVKFLKSYETFSFVVLLLDKSCHASCQASCRVVLCHKIYISIGNIKALNLELPFNMLRKGLYRVRHRVVSCQASCRVVLCTVGGTSMGRTVDQTKDFILSGQVVIHAKLYKSQMYLEESVQNTAMKCLFILLSWEPTKIACARWKGGPCPKRSPYSNKEGLPPSPGLNGSPDAFIDLYKAKR